MMGCGGVGCLPPPGRNSDPATAIPEFPYLEVQSMGCKKDKPKKSNADGKFECSKCGAVVKKKDKVCKPKKIKS